MEEIKTKHYLIKQSEQDMLQIQICKKRYARMKTARAKREKIRHDVDKKRENEIVKNVDSSGNIKANPKIPFEQILIETYLGMTEKGIPVKMGATGRVDGGVLEVGKYIFDHFLETELSIEEIRTYRQRKGRYGTGVIYSGVWCETKSMPTGDSTNRFDKSKDRVIQKLRHIGVKSIDIRACYFDERAKNIKDAVDCIMAEHIAEEEFYAKYCVKNKDGTYKSIEGITNAEYVKTTTPQSNEQTNTDAGHEGVRNITLYHYWNQVSGIYCIRAGDIMLYNGYMQELHTMLPLTPIQHYPDSENLYGIGIPVRFESVKPYINSILKVTLDSAWRDAGDALIVMGNQELSGDMYISPGETTLREFSGDKEQLVPFRTQSNIQQNVAILQLMDDYGIVCTGLNVKGTYSSPANTAFEAGIMKDEQNNRLKSVVTNDQIGLDRAFTMMRSNIVQFAPYLLSDYLYDDTTQAFKGNLYEIRIDNKKIETVKKKDNKGKEYTSYEVNDDDGEYSMFEVSKENMPLFKGLKLTIETPTTLNITKTIEKEQFPTMLQSLGAIKEIFPEANIGNGDDVVRKFMMTYDVDTTNYSQKSKKDKLKEEQNKIIEEVSTFNTGYTNENPDQQATTIPQGGVATPAGGAPASQSTIGQSLSNSINSSITQ